MAVFNGRMSPTYLHQCSQVTTLLTSVHYMFENAAHLEPWTLNSVSLCNLSEEVYPSHRLSKTSSTYYQVHGCKVKYQSQTKEKLDASLIQIPDTCFTFQLVITKVICGPSDSAPVLAFPVAHLTFVRNSFFQNDAFNSQHCNGCLAAYKRMAFPDIPVAKPQDALPKRKRGRPRILDRKPEVIVAKRKPGRPRKNVTQIKPAAKQVEDASCVITELHDDKEVRSYDNLLRRSSSAGSVIHTTTEMVMSQAEARCKNVFEVFQGLRPRRVSRQFIAALSPRKDAFVSKSCSRRSSTDNPSKNPQVRKRQSDFPSLSSNDPKSICIPQGPKSMNEQTGPSPSSIGRSSLGHYASSADGQLANKRRQITDLKCPIVMKKPRDIRTRCLSEPAVNHDIQLPAYLARKNVIDTDICTPGEWRQKAKSGTRLQNSQAFKNTPSGSKIFPYVDCERQISVTSASSTLQSVSTAKSVNSTATASSHVTLINSSICLSKQQVPSIAKSQRNSAQDSANTLTTAKVHTVDLKKQKQRSEKINFIKNSSPGKEYDDHSPVAKKTKQGNNTENGDLKNSRRYQLSTSRKEVEKLQTPLNSFCSQPLHTSDQILVVPEIDNIDPGGDIPDTMLLRLSPAKPSMSCNGSKSVSARSTDKHRNQTFDSNSHKEIRDYNENFLGGSNLLISRTESLVCEKLQSNQAPSKGILKSKSHIHNETQERKIEKLHSKRPLDTSHSKNYTEKLDSISKVNKLNSKQQVDFKKHVEKVDPPTQIEKPNSKAQVERQHTQKPVEKLNFQGGTQKLDSKKLKEKVDSRKQLDSKKPVENMQVEKLNSMKQIEKVDPRNRIEKPNSEALVERLHAKNPVEKQKDIQKPDSKKQKEKVDTKRNLLKVDPKKPVEKLHSKVQVQKLDSEKPIEKLEFKKQVDRLDSKKYMGEFDSKKQVEEQDSKNQMVKLDSIKQVREPDSKKQTEMLDSQELQEKQDSNKTKENLDLKKHGEQKVYKKKVEKLSSSTEKEVIYFKQQLDIDNSQITDTIESCTNNLDSLVCQLDSKICINTFDTNQDFHSKQQVLEIIESKPAAVILESGLLDSKIYIESLDTDAHQKQFKSEIPDSLAIACKTPLDCREQGRSHNSETIACKLQAPPPINNPDIKIFSRRNEAKCSIQPPVLEIQPIPLLLHSLPTPNMPTLEPAQQEVKPQLDQSLEHITSTSIHLIPPDTKRIEDQDPSAQVDVNQQKQVLMFPHQHAEEICKLYHETMNQHSFSRPFSIQTLKVEVPGLSEVLSKSPIEQTQHTSSVQGESVTDSVTNAGPSGSYNKCLETFTFEKLWQELGKAASTSEDEQAYESSVVDNTANVTSCLMIPALQIKSTEMFVSDVPSIGTELSTRGKDIKREQTSSFTSNMELDHKSAQSYIYDHRSEDYSSLNLRAQHYSACDSKPQHYPARDSKTLCYPGHEKKFQDYQTYMRMSQDDPRLNHTEYYPTLDQKSQDYPTLDQKSQDYPTLDQKSQDYPTLDQKLQDYPALDQKSQDYSTLDHKSQDYPTLDQKSQDYPTLDQKSQDYPTLNHKSQGYPTLDQKLQDYPTLDQKSQDYPTLDQKSQDYPGINHKSRDDHTVNPKSEDDPKLNHKSEDDPQAYPKHDLHLQNYSTLVIQPLEVGIIPDSVPQACISPATGLSALEHIQQQHGHDLYSIYRHLDPGQRHLKSLSEEEKLVQGTVCYQLGQHISAPSRSMPNNPVNEAQSSKTEPKAEPLQSVPCNSSSMVEDCKQEASSNIDTKPMTSVTLDSQRGDRRKFVLTSGRQVFLTCGHANHQLAVVPPCLTSQTINKQTFNVEAETNGMEGLHEVKTAHHVNNHKCDIDDELARFYEEIGSL